MTPTVSVIIPTINRPDLLSKAIKSVLDQDFQNFEVIVVNDAGDDVSEIIKGFSDDRIKYYSHERNAGLSATRNTGIKEVAGKYIAYLDDDDEYFPNHLSTLIEFLEQSPDYQAAYTDAVYGICEEIDGVDVEKKQEVLYSRDFDFDEILKGNFIPVLCMMHRRDCLDEVGLFDTHLKRTEDWDLWIRLSRRFNLAHIRKETCKVRWSSNGSTMTSNQSTQRLLWVFSEINIYYKHIDLLNHKPNLSNSIHAKINAFLQEICDVLWEGLAIGNTEVYRLLGYQNIRDLYNRFNYLMCQYGHQYQTLFSEIILITTGFFESSYPVDKEIYISIVNKLRNIKQDNANLLEERAKSEQRIETLNAKLEEQEGTIENLTGQIAQQEQEIIYAASKSWAITRPLRKMMRYIKKKPD